MELTMILAFCSMISSVLSTPSAQLTSRKSLPKKEIQTGSRGQPKTDENRRYSIHGEVTCVDEVQWGHMEGKTYGYAFLYNGDNEGEVDTTRKSFFASPPQDPKPGYFATVKFARDSSFSLEGEAPVPLKNTGKLVIYAGCGAADLNARYKYVFKIEGSWKKTFGTLKLHKKLQPEPQKVYGLERQMELNGDMDKISSDLDKAKIE